MDQGKELSRVLFRFRNARTDAELDSVTFEGMSILLGELKKAIVAKRHIRMSCDLLVYNLKTSEEYHGDDTEIPKNTMVIVHRVPATKLGNKTDRPRGTRVGTGIAQLKET